ncbi:MAG: DUF3575 domain-containing protein [Dysgonamonadaceae bacterium]|nr:DUF3575 domain-containing protein [Dysgonamonadaceae bacterium]
MIFLVIVPFFQGHAQGEIEKITTPVFSINNNLLYSATTNINLGIEFRLDRDFTLKIPVVYNPWTFEDNKKISFILTQPELRWWFCEPFFGHFMGFNVDYAFFNTGGIGTDYMKHHRFEGNLYGAGLSYGYQFYLGKRWNLEMSIGAGYAYLDYDVYYCESCGEFIKKETKHYIGLKQVGISLIYIIK